MKKPQLDYVLDDGGSDCLGLIWKTPKGQIITLNRNIDPSRKIRVRDSMYGDTIKEVELLSILEDVLSVECEK